MLEQLQQQEKLQQEALNKQSHQQKANDENTKQQPKKIDSKEMSKNEKPLEISGEILVNTTNINNSNLNVNQSAPSAKPTPKQTPNKQPQKHQPYSTSLVNSGFGFGFDLHGGEADNQLTYIVNVQPNGDAARKGLSDGKKFYFT